MDADHLLQWNMNADMAIAGGKTHDYGNQANPQYGTRTAATGGLVTTIVTPDELPALHVIAQELGISLAVISDEQAGLAGALGASLDSSGLLEGQEGQLDVVRSALEDLFNLQ